MYLCCLGYYFRNFRFGDALSAWKEASHVVSRYNFNPRDDEEAYKEFQGIANGKLFHFYLVIVRH